MSIFSRLKNIKTVVLDMDGVLTDGTMQIYGNEWLRTMHVRDGFALQLAIKKGLQVIVISGSQSQPVKERLYKLGLTHVFMSVQDKKAFLTEFAIQHHISLETTLFMGDDMPDVESMKIVGLAACPADGIEEVRSISSYISPYKGGQGCVRDVLEKILKLNGVWQVEENVAST